MDRIAKVDAKAAKCGVAIAPGVRTGCEPHPFTGLCPLRQESCIAASNEGGVGEAEFNDGAEAPNPGSPTGCPVFVVVPENARAHRVIVYSRVVTPAVPSFRRGADLKLFRINSW